MGDADALTEAEALGEAEAFVDGDADALTEAEALGEAELLADAEALAVGEGSRLGRADGTTVAIGVGLTPMVDWNLFRSQTRYTASKMIISKITTMVIFLLIDNHLQAEQWA